MNQDLPAIPWEFRRQTMTCSEALLRILREGMYSYGDDLEAFMIYLAVACANVGGAIRDPGLIAEPPPGRMARRYYRNVSRRAIAASTGLPRETVRRKIADFLESGALVADGAGVRIPEGVIEQGHNYRFAQVLVREFRRTGSALAALDPPETDPQRVAAS
jgi:hypothetical protein